VHGHCSIIVTDVDPRAGVLTRCRQVWSVASRLLGGPPIGDIRIENPDRAKHIVRLQLPGRQSPVTAIGEELCLASLSAADHEPRAI
jgi:hypothetical protein